jgi:hypothetical protein
MTMKTNARVSHAFTRFNSARLIEFIRNFLKLMANNAAFLDPDPPLDTIETSTDQYQKLVQQALSGDRKIMMARRIFRPSLIVLVRAEADYVQKASKGNPVVLVSSGFAAINPRQPIGPLDPPAGLTLSYTTLSGQFRIKFKPVYGARSYSIQIAPNPNGPWADALLSTRSANLIEGFIPGTRYWIRVRANGTRHTSGWSMPNSIMAV